MYECMSNLVAIPLPAQYDRYTMYDEQPCCHFCSSAAALVASSRTPDPSTHPLSCSKKATTSDPYISVCVPEGENFRDRKVAKTKTKKKTLSPIWEEQFNLILDEER
jgi:hypothetical protein